MAELDYAGSELQLFSAAHHWKRYWSKRVAPFVRGRVLDVGAGIGSTIDTLGTCDGTRWTALEPDPGLAARIHARRAEFAAPVEVVCGQISDLPKDEGFDTLLYIDVLEHIEDDAGELRAARDLIVQGGHLVVLAPAHQWLYSPFDEAIGHFRRYSRPALRACVPAGLEVVSLVYLDSVGLIASLANRLLLRSAQPTPAQIALWDRVMVPASRWIDPLFAGSLGKSVLMVARKA